MNVSTTKCHQFNHPEFILEADAAHVPDVYLKDQARFIEEMVASGSVFKPGQTLQIGWMLTQVAARQDGKLTLVEPDMRSFPIQFVPGITNTLRTLMLQLFMLDSVGLREQINLPNVRQTIVVCTRYTEANFFMERKTPVDQKDSGWFVGCADVGHDHTLPANLRAVSLYEAYLNQPGIQGFVSFPVGAGIVVDVKKGVTILKGNDKLEIIPGSFLDQWIKRGMGRS